MDCKGRLVLLAVVLVAQVLASASGGETNSLDLVRLGLRQYRESLSDYESREAVVANFGLPWRRPSHLGLSVAVSNSLDDVFAHFEQCAANPIDRFIILSAGWEFDDDYYLIFLDHVLDLVSEGRLSPLDMQWFRSAHRDSGKETCLLRRYGEPFASNVIDKVERTTGQTNECRRIRTGEALREHKLFVSEMNANR